jgi:hypothetical protein
MRLDRRRLQVSFCGRRRRHVASTTLLTNAASFFLFSAWLLPANPFLISIFQVDNILWKCAGGGVSFFVFFA